MLLRETEYMSTKSDSEPRFWRTQWHHDLFTSVCTKTKYLVIALAALESVIAEQGRAGGKKFPTFVQLAEKSFEISRIFMDILGRKMILHG